MADKTVRFSRVLMSCLLLFLLIPSIIRANTAPVWPYADETPAQRDERMAWWREARFGMFIHWGVYAVPAGEWNGITKRGYAEWIMHHARIPLEHYEPFAGQFNPVDFDAAAWVRMAKDAGMKYLVITSKHHDGFCLWGSDVTNYDVMDATPFKRDILKELASECQKQGLTLCFYYSIMDWHHPDYLPRRVWEKRSAEGADFQRYIAYMKAQLKELVTRYDPAVLWFDGEWDDTWTHEEGLKLYDYVRSLKPDIIINNRVDKGRFGMEGTFDAGQFAGDFGTPEQRIPATGLDYDWESCMTMNNHWGWNKHDKNFKSTEDLIQKLIDIASKGGNYLLNIGPKADGTFPQESIDRLAEIGQWMKVNGESIYGTTASPFAKLTWGRCTTKARDGGATLYLHVFDWPADGKLLLSGLKNRVTSATLLDSGKTLKTAPVPDGVVLTLPSACPDPIATVIAVEISGDVNVEIVLPRQSADGTIVLPAALADIHNQHGKDARLEKKDGVRIIGNWTEASSWVEWSFVIDRPGEFAVSAEVAVQDAESKAEVVVGGTTLPVTFVATGGYDAFVPQGLGRVKIDKAGTYSVQIKPVQNAWEPVNVRSVTLRPLSEYQTESKAAFDARMAWWRQARFGMFIHWGLYAVPAGEWNGKQIGGYAEWIMHHGKIPLEQYEPFAGQFNPVDFDAAAWVRMAKDAGMKYLVITSKHHDGFCLWGSDVTNYDVMDATPFKRDILKELASECQKQGLTLCFYYSIMDWHHPDYLPRRTWETRSAEGADFQRYIAYMKAHLKELVTRYDPAVLWFDGEWDDTWTHEEGLKLYDYVRSLKPDIIINNRVDKGRQGAKGTFDINQFAGDFGTPEQEIPATGLDYDWESCITMNQNWGWSKSDKDFKSTEHLIRSLVDIASKGGNYLLNIGPKGDGTFPQESIDRLAEIGQWMKVNGESIYGTTASPFSKLDWGRCTQKQVGDETVLYLHVFTAPAEGTLLVPGLGNEILEAMLLAVPQKLTATRSDKGILVQLPAELPDPVDTVIVLKIKDQPKIKTAARSL